MRNYSYILCVLFLSILLSPIVLADSTIEQPATQDTYIYKNVPDTNNDEAGLFLYEWTNPARAILSWDISALNVVDIQSANISLFYWSNIGDPQGRSYCIRELTETDWDETQATWNDRLTGTPWNTAGAENDATNQACISMPGPDAWGWLTFNITDLVIRLAITESQTVLNFMFISPEGGATYSASLHDSEYLVDTAKRPKLGLEFTAGVSAFNLTTIIHTGIDQVLVNGTIKTNGTITSINSSQIANITSIADTGYIFLNYNGSETDNPYLLNMTQDYIVHVYGVGYTLSLISDLSSIFSSQLLFLTSSHIYNDSGLSGSSINFQRSSDNETWTSLLSKDTLSGSSSINHAQPEAGTWYFRAVFSGDGTYPAITTSSLTIEVKQLSGSHIIKEIISQSQEESESKKNAFPIFVIIIIVVLIAVILLVKRKEALSDEGLTNPVDITF